MALLRKSSLVYEEVSLIWISFVEPESLVFLNEFLRQEHLEVYWWSNIWVFTIFDLFKGE